jgi:uroporphyrin-III C-methyltransferase
LLLHNRSPIITIAGIKMPSGTIYLVGAGPGDPELLTMKAHRLLRQADVVLHDDLVPPAILCLASDQAELVNVGKRCGAKKITQDEINARMIESARRGFKVVRLKSGDPGIFGRLAEETDAIESARISYEVVPGVTAGFAAAACLRVSLTDRRKSARVVIVTEHKAHTADPSRNMDWKSLACEDATLIVYMPGHEFAALREELLGAGLPGDLPAVLVSCATTPEQRKQYTTIENLVDLQRLKAPSILLIGRSLEGRDEGAFPEGMGHGADYRELILSE